MTNATATLTATKGALVVTFPAHQSSDAWPVAGIARCRRKSCRAAARVDGFARRASMGYGRFEQQLHWPVLTCSCGAEYPDINKIKAHTTEHVCDSRCTHAVGHNCECSCGGKNHGQGWNIPMESA